MPASKSVLNFKGMLLGMHAGKRWGAELAACPSQGLLFVVLLVRLGLCDAGGGRPSKSSAAWKACRWVWCSLFV